MNNVNKPVSILLVDDHSVVREGYRRLLERQGRIEVVAEAGDGEQAYTLFRTLKPDIIIMDITLPGASGIEVMRRMLRQSPSTKVLIFSMHEDVIFVRRALQSGAMGFVTKASAPGELIEAVLRIAAGRKFVSPILAQNIVLLESSAEAGPAEGLSEREFEVLQGIAQGRSIRTIAQMMGLTPKTVANHQTAIKQKLGVQSNFQLLKAAERLGLGK